MLYVALFKSDLSCEITADLFPSTVCEGCGTFVRVCDFPPEDHGFDPLSGRPLPTGFVVVSTMG